MFRSLRAYHSRPKRSRRNKKLKKTKRRAQKRRLEKTAQWLKANVPKSERWFLEQYTPHPADVFNMPFCGYIPDIRNTKFMYIIEIDGAYHETLKQKNKDLKRDRLFSSIGYKTIRIKAYDQPSLDVGLQAVLELMNAGPVLDDNTAAGAPLDR